MWLHPQKKDKHGTCLLPGVFNTNRRRDSSQFPRINHEGFHQFISSGMTMVLNQFIYRLCMIMFQFNSRSLGFKAESPLNSYPPINPHRPCQIKVGRWASTTKYARFLEIGVAPDHPLLDRSFLKPSSYGNSTSTAQERRAAHHDTALTPGYKARVTIIV